LVYCTVYVYIHFGSAVVTPHGCGFCIYWFSPPHLVICVVLPIAVTFLPGLAFDPIVFGCGCLHTLPRLVGCCGYYSSYLLPFPQLLRSVGCIVPCYLGCLLPHSCTFAHIALLVHAVAGSARGCILLLVSVGHLVILPFNWLNAVYLGSGLRTFWAFTRIPVARWPFGILFCFPTHTPLLHTARGLRSLFHRFPTVQFGCTLHYHFGSPHYPFPPPHIRCHTLPITHTPSTFG